MAKAARSEELQAAFTQHLAETEAQVERLQEVFRLLEIKAKTKPCKGMAGLVTEGQEVISDGKAKDDVAADLALIAAAQKVEHYEISSYLMLAVWRARPWTLKPPCFSASRCWRKKVRISSSVASLPC